MISNTPPQSVFGLLLKSHGQGNKAESFDQLVVPIPRKCLGKDVRDVVLRIHRLDTYLPLIHILLDLMISDTQMLHSRVEASRIGGN